MIELTKENAGAYWRNRAGLTATESIDVAELAGGVSNVVLKVSVAGCDPIILKQSREQLRTRAAWFSRLDRIWSERAALDLLGSILPPGNVPAVLFADPDNYVLAISAAPAGSIVWKEMLLNRSIDPAIGARAGDLLGLIHVKAIDHELLSGRLADVVVFDQLRVDPYYRTVARAHADIEPMIHELIERMRTAEPKTFVHGDFSPKNMLIHNGNPFVVDFETAHAGDAAFDLGFFLSHLSIKTNLLASNRREFLELIGAFRSAYDRRIAGSPFDNDRYRGRVVAHTLACALARIDGKSPVEYLPDELRRSIREKALDAIVDRVSSWDDFVSRFL